MYQLCSHMWKAISRYIMGDVPGVRPRAKLLENMSNAVFFTHAGLICNDPVIQPLLPQVIFVGAPGMTWAEWSVLVADPPLNVFIKRMPRGWNNADQHKLIIRILGLVLRPFLATRQPILCFDAASLHLNAEVLHEIHTAHMWYLLIPARLTWLLQPLDTNVFFEIQTLLEVLILGYVRHLCF